MDIFFQDGNIYVNKKCELCRNKFVTKWGKREQSFCSSKCGNTYASNTKQCKENHLSAIKNKQKETRENQIKLYKLLELKLNRDPMKKEWEQLCLENSVPFRIRTSNEKKVNEYCFRSYNELKESANLNFKVVSIEVDGYEDVYNGTVDFNHNFYIFGSESKSKYDKPQFNHILTRQCGEAVLGSNEACVLGSIVLPNHIINVNTNWRKLEETVKNAVRFLDNTIDVNHYVLDSIKVKENDTRRIGLGIIGLASYLFMKRLRYGSPEAIREVERVMKFIRDKTYETLIELAIEKGAFPKFDPVEYGKADFIRSLPASLRIGIKTHGSRCATALAVAPGGTISLIADVTSGMEPLFMKAYKRSDRISERIYVHPIYEDVIRNNKPNPDWLVDTTDLEPEDHLNTHVAVQSMVDGGASKTLNLQAGFQKSKLSNLLLEYIRDIKGVTIYVDGSREGQILNKVTKKELSDYLKSNNSDNCIDEDVANLTCKSGACDI